MLGGKGIKIFQKKFRIPSFLSRKRALLCDFLCLVGGGSDGPAGPFPWAAAGTIVPFYVRGRRGGDGPVGPLSWAAYAGDKRRGVLATGFTEETDLFKKRR